MTHQAHPSVTRDVVQLLAEHGFDGVAQAMELFINECMKLERQQALGVGPYQRGEARRGQANGFKPKRLKTRVGELQLDVPQVRGAKFYPQALERGSRSEKALRLALAEMYVQGVSTSKVIRITEELGGCEISSSDVSRATALLDEQLDRWRNRSLSRSKYLVLDARYEKIRHGGCVVDCAVVIALGIDAEGRRSVLGVSVSLSEAEVLSEAGLARRSLHLALDAKEAQDELQRRWAAKSCRRLLLENAEALFIAMENAGSDRRPQWPAPSSAKAEFNLTDVRLRLRLADEDAKFNLNALHARHPDQVRLSVMQLAGGQASPRLQPDISREAAMRRRWYSSWGQVFNLRQAFSQGDLEAVLTATAELTCWGEGKLNIRRASDRAIETAVTAVAGREPARKLLAARHDYTGDLLLSDLLAKLDLRRPDQVRLGGILSDRSSCYSLWLELEQGPRRWYYLAVAGDRAAAGPSHVLTFSW